MEDQPIYTYDGSSTSSNEGGSDGGGSADMAMGAGTASGSGMRRRRGGKDGGGRGGGTSPAAAGIDPAILQWSRYLGYDGDGNIPAGGIGWGSKGAGRGEQQESLLSLRSDVLLASDAAHTIRNLSNHSPRWHRWDTNAVL